jgi:hypothetical protein
MPLLPKTPSAIALIALSALASASALASEPSPAWSDLLAIEGHLGLGTPTGLAGLAVDFTLHPQVSLELGAGRGLVALQLAAMAHVRPFFITPNLAPGIGVGVSGGDTGTLKVQDFRELRFKQAVWLNGELFLELRRGSFHLRPYAGIARRLRHSGCTYIDEQADTSQPCSEREPSEVAILDDWRTILYTGVAIGLSLL